jgi:hypothetical protein
VAVNLWLCLPGWAGLGLFGLGLFIPARRPGWLVAGRLAGTGAGAGQPWRCLWRGFSQITMTVPRRRMTLHFSQILLTDGLTFNFVHSYL